MTSVALALLALHLQPVASNTPNRQPQLAAGNGVTAMVFGSGEAIWFSSSSDHGGTWSKPAKVAALPKLLLGRHRGPRVAHAGRSIVVSAISSDPGDLLAWRSADGGRTWSAPLTVNDQPKASREGLHAMAADVEGHVAMAWLDDRSGKGKRLVGAFSNDGGATWGKNVELYQSPSGTICQCCAPSPAALGGDRFAVMWRNVIEGSRDLYVRVLQRGRPVDERVEKAGRGTWKLDACPMDGGGIAERHGAIGTAWRREHDVYLAEPGKAEVRVGTGMDVAMGANEKGYFVLWSTPAGIELHAPGAAKAERLSEAGAFPAIVRMPNGQMLAAWEENGAIATMPLVRPE